MSGRITETTDGAVRVLVFDRPEKKNAFTVAMYEALVDGLERAAGEDAVRAVLLRGAGGAFTAGNDLGDFITRPPEDRDHPVLRFLRTIATYEKPLLAAVHGPAVGIGTTMLLHCDLVFASADARLRLPFVPLGLVPEGASSVLLPRLVGPQRAAEMLLLGEFFGAEKAAELGLVNEVLPDPDEALRRAIERAKAVAEMPKEAVRSARALLRHATEQEVLAALDREAVQFLDRLKSQEAMEAMQAFFARR